MSEPVFLFGASGFVGRNLADRLVRDGHDVIGVSSSGAKIEGLSRCLSLDEFEEASDLPENAVAMHVANYRYDSSRFEMVQSDVLRNNVTLNARILHACAERKVSELRLASSVAVFPGSLERMDDAVPLDLNQAPIAGESFYAWSKRFVEIAADLYAQRFGLNTVAFRLSNPYGPYDSTNPDKAHVAPAFVMKALDGNPEFPVRGDPAVERDFIYVGDVVDAFIKSLEWRGRNETYNLCTGVSTPLSELARVCMKVAGVEKPIKAGAPGAFGPAKRVSTAERVKAALGLEFCSLEEGMGPTVAWYKENFRP